MKQLILVVLFISGLALGQDKLRVFVQGPVKLSTDLASPARLNKRDLHPYRLKVKELRNWLQMADNADQQEFISGLGEVKDAIGGWHDWQELTAIARDILDHGPRCQLLRELQRISEVKY